MGGGSRQAFKITWQQQKRWRLSKSVSENKCTGGLEYAVDLWGHLIAIGSCASASFLPFKRGHVLPMTDDTTLTLWCVAEDLPW
ncbi:hypothetical protein NDU88_007723 [Pleurodeles waltl]|uniref:Uncharacterized protein n=1 Tax=Pleurodeles waltl TaxID=8319 RepID=A0AAV7PPU6_PLEWA|nr:hypothetical protein NDU88_007723 [Pleurodeles waltl]